MPEDFIQVNVPATPGKKLKSWTSVDGGGNVVESEAVTLTDSAGNEVVVATEATAAAIASSVASIDSKIVPPATQAVTHSVAAINTPVQLLAADPTRVGFSIYNQSEVDLLYILVSTAGGPVSPTFFTTILQPHAYFEDAFGYTGSVFGIWGSVNPGSQALINVYTA